MSRPAPIPDPALPPPTDRPALARALIGRQLDMLTRLAEIGMQVAEGCLGAEHPDPALAYARTARAVRLTLALQSRLLDDLAALERTEAGLRRARVRRAIERAVEAARDDEDEIERLSDECRERLTETDDADITGRPLAEVVARICADLGLSAEETAWAASQVSGAATGSPPAPEPIAAGAPGARPAARSRASPLPTRVAH